MIENKEKIYSIILGRIESGEYPHGSKMPPERNLAAEFKTTQWCLHTTMNELEQNGFVERKRSIGTFVSKNIETEKVYQQKNRNSKMVVAMVAHDFHYSRYGFEDIIGRMERDLENTGFNVSYEEMPEKEITMKKFLNNCTSSGVKAIVIFPERKEWRIMHEYTQLFMDYPGNIYYFNRGLGPNDDLPFNCVGIDVLQGGLTAGKWVAEKGFENIAFVASSSFESYWLQQRYNGLKRMLKSCKKELKLISGTQLEKLLSPILEFVRKSSRNPVIVASEDKVAVPVYDFLESNGMKACNDFHMVSFDNQPSYRHYKMISVTPSLEDVGKLLTEMIANAELSKFHDISVINYQLKNLILERGIKL